MGFFELKKQVGLRAIADVCGVSLGTVSGWGRLKLPPSKYLFVLKLRWPYLDLNKVVQELVMGANQYRLSRGMSSLTD